MADGTVAAKALDSTDALVAVLNEAHRTGAQASTYDHEDVAAGRRAVTPDGVAHLMGGVDRELEQLENDPTGAGPPVVRIDRLQGLLKQLAGLEGAIRVKEPAFAPRE